MCWTCHGRYREWTTRIKTINIAIYDFDRDIKEKADINSKFGYLEKMVNVES